MAVVHRIEATNHTFFGIKNILKQRSTLLMFSMRELKLRYKQTLLGVAWVIFQPLLTVAIFTILFKRLSELYNEAIPYPAFALAGILIWQMFAFSVSRSAPILIQSRQLLTRLSFERTAIPFSACLVSMIDFIVGSILMVGIFIYYGIIPGWHLFMAPPILVVHFLFVLGCALFVAALNVRYRDIELLIPHLIPILFFLTPVIYSLSFLPDNWAMVLSLNPLTGIIETFRWCLFGVGQFPTASFVTSFVTGIGVFFLGLAYYRNAERTFADIL